jgi:hypothetical protein
MKYKYFFCGIPQARETWKNFWLLGGVRRTTSAGRFGGLRVFWGVAGLQTVRGDCFDP